MTPVNMIQDLPGWLQTLAKEENKKYLLATPGSKCTCDTTVGAAFSWYDSKQGIKFWEKIANGIIPNNPNKIDNYSII